MKTPTYLKKLNWRKAAIYFFLAAALAFLMLFKLGSLTTGVSAEEVSSSNLALGWHGLYHNPLYLPLNVLRSIVFYLFNHHSAFLVRLPDALFGAATIVSFAALVYLWHGKRTAYYSGIMFAASAWVLHVSRLASYDVLYIWGITSAVLAYVCLNEFEDSRLAWYLNAFLLGLLATIPGLIWLSALMIYFERQIIKEKINSLSILPRIVSFILVAIWLPLIIYRSHINHTYKQWLGLPEHFASIFHIIKDFVAVPFHLLVRGPLLPNLWLGKASVLDFFALVMLFVGAYTYITHRNNSRSRLLASLLGLSIVLIGLNGSVSFGLIIPLAYLLVAMGLSYFTHSWKKVFPRNPVAKWVGLILIILAIALSCAYNLRAYFIAWPHNPPTYTTFDQSL